MDGGPYEITRPTLDILASAPWTNGNVRELRNCLRAMTELHVNKQLTPASIPNYIWKELDSVEGEAPEDTSDLDDVEEKTVSSSGQVR